jgi:hypothetical protein
MPVREFVEFASELPYDSVEDEERIIVPPGRTVTEWLQAELKRSGFGNCSDVDQHEDYGWYFSITSQHQEFQSLLQGGWDIDGTSRGWLLILEFVPSIASLVKGLFRRRDNTVFLSLCRTVQDVLTSDKRTSSIRWYFRDDYDNNKSLPTACPFCPTAVDASWATSTPKALANAIRQAIRRAKGSESEPSDSQFAVLADALEEAGCTNTDLLRCLRTEYRKRGNCHAINALASQGRTKGPGG